MPQQILTVSWFDQLAVLVSGCLVKPLYMLLSLVLIVWLWRAGSRDVRHIKCGLIGFLVGETICALNYLLTDSTSNLLEVLHGAGMVWALIFIPWGFYLLVDERILHLSQPQLRCLMHPLCQQCDRLAGRCGMERLLVWLGPALAVVATLPFSHPLVDQQRAYLIFSSPVLFQTTRLTQLIEIRIYSGLALIFLIAASLFLAKYKTPGGWARLFFPGLGLLLFALLRVFLVYGFNDYLIWGNFWEEGLELLSILMIGAFIWVFRGQLLKP